MRKYRSETRNPVTAQAEVTYDIGGGFVRKVKATVQDSSKSGMGLLVPLPFPIGANIKILGGSATQTAVVRRCMAQGSNHLLGVQFQR